MPLTLAIDSALKTTEAKYPGVEAKAIHGDINLSEDPAVILGPNGAHQYLTALKRSKKERIIVLNDQCKRLALIFLRKNFS